MGLRQTFGLFFEAFENGLGVTRTEFGLAIGIQMLFWGIFVSIFGILADKFGGNKAVFPRHDASISGEHHLQGGRQQSKKGGGGRGGGGGKASGVSTRGAGSNAPSFQERNRRKAASSRKRDVI